MNEFLTALFIGLGLSFVILVVLVMIGEAGEDSSLCPLCGEPRLQCADRETCCGDQCPWECARSLCDDSDTTLLLQAATGGGMDGNAMTPW